MALDLKDNVEKEKPKENQNSKPRSNKKDAASNIVFVGTKPLSNYIRSVVFQFKKKGNKAVIIKSRGKFISKAVDVAEIARRKYLQEDGIKATDIKIESESFKKEDKEINVSAIEITLSY